MMDARKLALELVDQIRDDWVHDTVMDFVDSHEDFDPEMPLHEYLTLVRQVETLAYQVEFTL